MAGISISDDRPKVIDVRLISTLRYWNRQTCFSLFPVVKQLRFEEVVDFVRNSVLLHVSHMLRNLNPTFHSESHVKIKLNHHNK